MKVTASSDWRDAIPFETPMLVADLQPGDPTRCSICGVESDPLPRTELWAFKHRHPNHHAGYVRFYCREHVPVVARPSAPTVAARSRRVAAPSERRPPARRVADSDKVRAMCPNCFVEVSAKGECGMCGWTA